MNSDYLTESSLSSYLYILSDDWVHNKSVPESSLRSRPDYRSDKLKLIVEFDGYHHYNSSKRITQDKINTINYVSLGYKVVRIPYFVQLTEEVFNHLFKTNISFKSTNSYPHGFIDAKAMLPCDYCELGIKRFLEDLERFWFIRTQIIDSLVAKIEDLCDITLVLPTSLQRLVNVRSN